MDIILNVLENLHFVFRNSFFVECAIDNHKSMAVDVKLLISDENDSQVFLVIDCENSQLVDYVDGKIIKEIALKFRKNECHRAEMDRNTSLLLVCKHAVDAIDTSSKVKIEDDPYYFKKYVFSYDEIGLENASNWLEENKEKGSVISLIQEYITDTNHFARYKDNHQNEAIYTFFMELVTKLHCFPMKTAETKNIKTVRDYLEIEMDSLRNKLRKPIDIDSKKIEAFLESGVNCDNADDICQKWNSLFVEKSEN